MKGYTVKKQFKEDKYIMFICGVIIFIIFVYKGYLLELLYSFSTDGEKGGSDGLNNFLPLFMTIGKKIGLGFVIDGYNTKYIFVRDVYPFKFYADDFGIFMAYFRFGIFIISLYIYLMVKSAIITVKCIFHKNRYVSLMVPLTIYIILSNITLNMYDSQRIINAILIFAVTSIIMGKVYDDEIIYKFI